MNINTNVYTVIFNGIDNRVDKNNKKIELISTNIESKNSIDVIKLFYKQIKNDNIQFIDLVDIKVKKRR